LSALEKIKKNAGYFYAIQKYGNLNLEKISFCNFIQDSNDILLILPDEDVEFRNSLETVYAITEMKKNIILLLRDFRVSLVNRKSGVGFIDYGIRDFTNFYLPTKVVLDKITERKYDIVIDLNLVEDIYASVIVKSVGAKYKIGFKRGKTDLFYNILIINNENIPAFSYRNLLNSLQMFQ
jgi:hypothetical protein